MVTFTTKILKQPGESGWSYIIIPKKQIALLKPAGKSSFRVRGHLDDFAIKFRSLLPVGDGRYILPINAYMRKGTGKKAGDRIEVSFEIDKSEKQFSDEFIACLKDDPATFDFFRTLTPSHQHYFNTWIASARTDETRARRIAQSMKALSERKGYQQMQQMRRKGSLK